MKRFHPFAKLYQKFELMKYQKYISTFSDPKENETRIAKTFDGLREYDLTRETGLYELDGARKKRIIMLDRKYFSDYLNSIRNGDSSFVSYLDNDDIIQNNIPHNLSVFIKRDTKKNVYAESVSSKILDFFGVSVAYYNSLKDSNLKIFSISLDFVKPNEIFYSFFEINCNYNFNKLSEFDTIEKSVRKSISIFSKSHILLNSKKEKDEIVKQVLYSILIRRFLLGDNDARSGNFGILYNHKTHKIRFAPNFDLGCTFSEHPYCKKALQYLRDKYPELYYKFIEKCDEFVSINKVTGEEHYKIFLTNTIDDENVRNNLNEKLENNLWAINKALVEIESEKSNQTNL